MKSTLKSIVFKQIGITMYTQSNECMLLQINQSYVNFDPKKCLMQVIKTFGNVCQHCQFSTLSVTFSIIFRIEMSNLQS